MKKFLSLLLLLSVSFGAFGQSDVALKFAQSIIATSFGDNVSVDLKSKTLRKFGENYDIDAGVSEQVWYTGGNETLSTTNDITTVSSSNASDTQNIYVEGHYFDANGDKIFHTQSVTLNGQNKVTLSQPLCRATRSFTDDSTETLGDVYVYKDGTISAGVPTDASTIHITQPIEYQQTLKCATSVSNTDYWLIQSATFSVLKSASASVDFTIWIRDDGGVFRPVAVFGVASAGSPFQKLFSNPIIVKPNSDVKVTAESNANNTAVSAVLDGLFAKIIN